MIGHDDVNDILGAMLWHVAGYTIVLRDVTLLSSGCLLHGSSLVVRWRLLRCVSGDMAFKTHGTIMSRSFRRWDFLMWIMAGDATQLPFCFQKAATLLQPIPVVIDLKPIDSPFPFFLYIKLYEIFPQWLSRAKRIITPMKPAE